MDMEVLGYVYLFQCGDLYKIGTSTDVEMRLKAVRKRAPGTVLLHSVLSDDPYRAEKFLHLKFGSERVTGEWFELSQEDVHWIKRIKTISRQYLDRHDTSIPKPVARDAAAKRVCLSCGNEFIFDMQKAHSKKYCNDDCQSDYASKVNRERYRARPYTYVPKRRPKIVPKAWVSCAVCGGALAPGAGPCCSSNCALAYKVAS